MGRYTDGDRRALIGMCPCLGTDGSKWELTSDPDPLLNCIGFAMGMDNVCVALDHPYGLFWCWWPPGVPRTLEPQSLVSAFEYLGFSVCPDGEIEADFDKVALYQKNGQWQHAAIIESKDQYHSKMGVWWDIVHRGGDLFHDDSYGDIYKYMKRPIVDRWKTQALKPEVSYMRTPHHVFAVMKKDTVGYGYVQIA